MKRVVLLVGGASAAVAMAVIGAGQAFADAPNVVGETYGSAVAILQSHGYAAVFGGSVGSDLPQSQCIVINQSVEPGNMWTTTWGGSGNMRLRLDCNLHPGQEKPKPLNTHSLVPPGGSVPEATDSNRPTPGAGTVTVTPKRIS